MYRNWVSSTSELRGSGVRSPYKKRSEEEFKILSGCSNCGKSESEVREKMGYKRRGLI